MTDTTTEQGEREQTREEKVAAHNDALRGEKLRRKIMRQHEWRIQVWAQCQLRIDEAQDGLKELGLDPIDLAKPDFSDPDRVQHYAEMTLTNR